MKLSGDCNLLCFEFFFFNLAFFKKNTFLFSVAVSHLTALWWFWVAAEGLSQAYRGLRSPPGHSCWHSALDRAPWLRSRTWLALHLKHADCFLSDHAVYMTYLVKVNVFVHVESEVN